MNVDSFVKVGSEVTTHFAVREDMFQENETGSRSWNSHVVVQWHAGNWFRTVQTFKDNDKGLHKAKHLCDKLNKKLEEYKLDERMKE